MKYIVGLLLFMGSTLPMFAQGLGGIDPDNPPEPGDMNHMMKHKVEVVLGTPGAGTASGSGYYEYGKSITISASAVRGYKFAYWLKNNDTEPYKTTASFTYIVEEDVKFTAIYERVKIVNAYISDDKAGKVTAVKRIVGDKEEAVLSTTANKDYFLQYWLRNDETEPYSTEPSFVYPLADDEWEVSFTAIYKYVYNPDDPGEPGDIDRLVKHNVTVNINDERAGSVSGSGRYYYGEVVKIATSGTVGYDFKGWLKDGQHYTNDKSFTYTVGTDDVVFTAEYVNTQEQLEEFGHAVYLSAEPVGCCTFTPESGTRYLPDDVYRVEAHPGHDWVFLGWYENGVKLNIDELSFSSYMGNDDITLVAKFVYDPEDPEDPDNPFGYIDNVGTLGDVNGDKVVDMVDVVALINIYLGKTTDYNLSICDINKDKQVDMVDVVAAINIYLGK